MLSFWYQFIRVAWKKSHCMIFVVPTVCSYFTLANSLITWQTFHQRVQSGLDLTRSTTDPFRVTSVCRRPSLRNMSMTVSIGVWSVTVIGACNATVWRQFHFNKNTLSTFLAPSLWAIRTKTCFIVSHAGYNHMNIPRLYWTGKKYYSAQ